MEEENKVGVVCEVCSVPCSLSCSYCKKVNYCGKDHQKADRKKHKSNCFPAILIKDAICGRYYIASKDIEEGATIFTDKALISGPSRSSFCDPVCLGCHRVVSSNYFCSQCGWSLCEKACEKNPNHAEMECKVFKKNGIPQVTQPHEYDFIKFIRTLLIKETDPVKWKFISNLESHREARRNCQKEAKLTAATFQFIVQKCRLTQFDYEDIDFSCGVNRVNSVSGNIVIRDIPRCVSLLFYHSSLLNHSCTPNARSIIREKDGIIWMELKSSINIKKGEPITQQYVSVVTGTMIRREALRECYFFDCSCTRCKDPTELKTNLSGVKCLISTCTSGYLLPINSLDYKSLWKCSECEETKEASFIIRLIGKIKERIDEIDPEVDNLENIKALESILMENRGVTLHKNHYLLLNLEYDIVQRFANTYTKVQNICPKRLERIIDYCKHSLEISQVVRPGSNNHRGGLLYYLARYIFILIKKAPNNKKLLIEQMKAVANEGRKILLDEPEGSLRGEMAVQLADYLEYKG